LGRQVFSNFGSGRRSMVPEDLHDVELTIGERHSQAKLHT
jgi:hypothetical protein